MAKMNRTERVALYRKILSEAPSVAIAVQQITSDVNTLVWSGTGKSLSRAERIEILEEIFEDADFRKSTPGLESFERAYGSTDFVNEADNSHILDVISALKRSTKD